MVTPDCRVDITTGGECNYYSDGPQPDNCIYTSRFDPDCGETKGFDSNCEQTVCLQIGGSDIPGECSFICTHSSSCNELTIPDDCTYTCYDSGCNYNYGCSECDYTSEWCGECDFDDCIFNDDTCTYNPDSGCSYDDNCGFDYNCDEFNCYEDCSEDCGDCGQECGEITCEGGDDYDPSCDECDI